jgi:cobalamin synthase
MLADDQDMHGKDHKKSNRIILANAFASFGITSAIMTLITPVMAIILNKIAKNVLIESIVLVQACLLIRFWLISKGIPTARNRFLNTSKRTRKAKEQISKQALKTYVLNTVVATFAYATTGYIGEWLFGSPIYGWISAWLITSINSFYLSYSFEKKH